MATFTVGYWARNFPKTIMKQYALGFVIVWWVYQVRQSHFKRSSQFKNQSNLFGGRKIPAGVDPWKY